MSERTRDLLRWYAAENPGVRTNIARLLNHGRLAGTGKLVILPVDQGFEHGPARSSRPIPPDTIRATISSSPSTPDATLMRRRSASLRRACPIMPARFRSS